MIEHLVTRVGETVGAWLYLVAAALAFGEAAFLLGMVLPGETALLVAGVFCEKGTLSLWVMIPVAVLAAVAGDSVGYEFGRHLGPGLRSSRFGRRVGDHRWAKVDGFLHRHGGKAVLLGRMTALLRALMPSMAGMSGMRYRTFLLWNALGALIWAPACVLLGFAFSGALNTIEKSLTWGPLVVLAVVVLAYAEIHRRKRRQERAEAIAFATAQDGFNPNLEE